MDKISITGNWKVSRDIIIEILKEVAILRGGEFGLCSFPYRWGLKLESVYIQVAERDAKFVKTGRIEFNPNKCDLEFVTGFIQEYMTSREVTRVDIAIDYYGVDISDYVVVTDRKVSTSWNYGRKLESVYIGSRSSERFYRIYDKRLEILEEEGYDIGEDLTRCEAVIRRVDTKLEGVFKGIKMYRVRDIKELGMLLVALYYPGEINMLNRRKKGRVLDMLGDYIEPYKDYLQYKEKVAEEIELLSNAVCCIEPFDNSIAQVITEENNFV